MSEAVDLADYLKGPDFTTRLTLPSGYALVFDLGPHRVAITTEDDRLAIWCNTAPLEINRLSDRKLYLEIKC